MKKTILLCGLLSMATLPGCAPILIAAAGATAGYAVSRDSVVMDLDKPWTLLWGAALEETKAQGLVKREDSKRGRIEATVQEVNVVISLKQLTASTIRVKVRARKLLMPKVEVAQQLAVAIVQRAEQRAQFL